MPRPSRMPTFEDLAEQIVIMHDAAQAGLEIATVDGDRGAAKTWRATLRQSERIIARYGIVAKPRRGPKPTLAAWRLLLNKPPVAGQQSLFQPKA